MLVQQDQEDNDADDHIPLPTQPEPALDIQVMRQLFAGLTETNRIL